MTKNKVTKVTTPSHPSLLAKGHLPDTSVPTFIPLVW